MKKCVFAGTFDPPTTGHKSVVEYCLQIFDEVVVAVGKNTAKSCFLSAEERINLLSDLFNGEPRVRVRTFDGAAVDVLMEEDTPFYVRGVRDCIDFEYEKRDLFASKKLMPQMIPLFIPAGQEQLHVSSSLVRNSIIFEKDWKSYVPAEIADKLQNILEKKSCSKNK